LSANTILFPLGMRLTTWGCVAVFVAVAMKRRDSKVLVAGCVWLLGFEAAFDISRFAVGKAGPFATWALPLIVGLFTLGWATWHRMLPSLPCALATAAVWLVWLAVGFPANQHTTVNFNWTAEVLNVSAKTLWALAYLLPLLRSRDALPSLAPRRGALSLKRPLI
jgi:hypothetical protein